VNGTRTLERHPERADSFIPTVAGEVVARNIQEHPETTEYELERFGTELYRHYDRTGMVGHDPQRVYEYLVRHKWRVTAAPLMHGIEETLLADILDKRANGEPLVHPDHLAATRFDRRLTNNGQHTYAGKKLNFLLASSALSHAAATHYIDDIVNDRTRYRPVWDAYYRFEEWLGILTHPQPFPMRLDPRERLKDNIVAANVTALDVLVAQAEHLRTSTGNIHDEMLRRVGQLSWAGSTNDSFFRRIIGSQYEDAEPPSVCPFTHDDRKLASDGIWRVRSLEEGPWSVPGFCPLDIPFRDPVRGGYTTGTALRLTSAVHIAEETLWAA
jgi:hypothetical protein